MTVTCDHCASPVPINGPTKNPLCPHCHNTSALKRICVEMTYADEGMMVVGSPYNYQTYKDQTPQCQACGESVPVDAYLKKVGATTTIPCPACGAGLATFPAPAWLKKELPDALQVFGADPEVAKEQADLVLTVDRQASKPIVMACPSCRGALSITEETERTTACSFCQVSVFLPDELWKRLHPVKVQRRWTLSYLGNSLQTGKHKAKAKKKNVEKAARKAKEAIQKKENKKRAKRSGLIAKLGAGGGVVVPLIVVGFFMMNGKGCSEVKGSFTAKGKPLGDFVLKPDICGSGQERGYFGVVLMPGEETKGARGAIKLVRDPVKGWLVQVQLPGSCKNGQCRSVTFDREECSQYDIAVRKSNTTVNDVRLLEGHLRLECTFKGKGKGTASAQLEFSGCG